MDEFVLDRLITPTDQVLWKDNPVAIPGVCHTGFTGCINR
jgi:hypothetical protein